MNEFRRTRNAMRTTGNLGQDALARWKAQGDITNFPMIRYQDKMENFRPSSFNMEDGSFLRMVQKSILEICQCIHIRNESPYLEQI